MTFTVNVIINLFDFFNVIVVAENKSIERDFVFEFIDKLRDIQTVLNSFDNEIGIPTVPYEKKERMVEKKE